MSDDTLVVGHVGYSPDFKTIAEPRRFKGLDSPLTPLEIKCGHKGGDEHHCGACGPAAQETAFTKFIEEGGLEVRGPGTDGFDAMLLAVYRRGWKDRP